MKAHSTALSVITGLEKALYLPRKTQITQKYLMFGKPLKQCVFFALIAAKK